MINLKAQFDQRIESLEKTLLEMPWEYREFYAWWANQQYFLIQHTTRYLTLCASKTDLDASAEFRWWSHHLSEEMGHDIVLLKDLEKLGHKFINEPLPEVRAIIAAQYYEIEKYGPDAQLGWALMLEGLSVRVCDIMAERIEKSIGEGMTKYLRMHGKADGDHYPEGISRIENLSDHRKSIILRNLEMSASLYEYFTLRIRKDVEENSLILEAA